jgi:hypothetical protein
MKPSSILAPALLAGACALGLAACGSPTATGSTAPATTGAGARANNGGGSGGGASGGGGFGGQGRGVPGADGLIAAVTGSTLQVQSRTQQVAVVVNAKTRVTQQVGASASAVTVGSCVVALPARTPGQATGGPADSTGGGATGTTPTRATMVAAATVQVSKPVNGVCAVGRGFGGPRQGQSDGTPPSGAPTGVGTRGPGGGFGGGGFGGFGGAFGTVTSVGSGTFTVTEPGRVPSDGSSAATTVTVTYTGSTAFTTTKPATSAAIKVGECARATGSQDDTGTVTATSLALSAAVDGQCTQGFGRRG